MRQALDDYQDLLAKDDSCVEADKRFHMLIAEATGNPYFTTDTAAALRALELDVEVMSAWPRDLWRKAFQSVWERFEYRRMPEVPDFRKYIAADLEERQSVLHRLESIRLRLETVRLRRQWDEEARRKKR